jgi:hypothetical protein
MFREILERVNGVFFVCENKRRRTTSTNPTSFFWDRDFGCKRTCLICKDVLCASAVIGRKDSVEDGLHNNVKIN